MTKEKSREPLDFEEVLGERKEKDRYSNIRFLLELVPVLLLSIGVFLRYQGSAYWKYALISGGLLVALVYLLFSRFLLKAEKQNTYEVVLSVASGIVIPVGILGVVFQSMFWDGADRMIQFALYGSFTLVFFTILSFLFHLKDQQAARFHRSLLARLLIFSAIVFSLTV